jgi:hypothetical protein
LGGLNGKDLNGDDYGIATDDAPYPGTNLSRLVITDTRASFWIRKPDALLGLEISDYLDSQNVAFGFGSLPDNIAIVPEPSTFVLLAIGLGALFYLGRKRRQP